MREAAIISTARTGLAKAMRGGFNKTHGITMGGHTVKHAIERAGIDAGEVEDIIFGCGQPEAATGHNIGRNAAVLSNLPLTVGGTTVNRYCSSGLQSISMAASQIMAGCYDTVIAGGVEQITMLSGKQNMDGFVNEIDYTVDKDECNRPGTTLEGLAALKPVFDPENGSVTAGNSSQLSDGASVTLVMSEEKALELGLKPMAYFRGFTTMGCEPDEMGIGPVFSVPKLLKSHNMSVDDIDLWELNEAFAVQVAYCRDQLGISMDKLNVNGGSISIGHPFGMTGSRQVGHIVRELNNQDKQFGIVTMCVGGGMGATGLFERYPS